MTQLELALLLTEDFFSRLFPANLPPIFVRGNTDILKSFQIEKLLNKCWVKKEESQVIEYLIYWKEHSPEWKRWYIIKKLDNPAKFVDD